MNPAIEHKGYHTKNNLRYPINEPGQRILDAQEYRTGTEQVEIDGKIYQKVNMEYWLQRGVFEKVNNKLKFLPDINKPLIKLGEASAFDQNKAKHLVAQKALETLQRLGLSKPIPESYLCTGHLGVPVGK